MPFHTIFHRSGKNLAIRDIFFTGAIDEFPAANVQAQVCFGGSYITSSFLQPLDYFFLLGIHPFPVANRIIDIGHAGVEYKIFIFAKAHLGILSMSMGREQCQSPTPVPYWLPRSR